MYQCHSHVNANPQQIDTDYYLPVLMQRYFLQTSVGRKRVDKFLRYASIILMLGAKTDRL